MSERSEDMERILQAARTGAMGADTARMKSAIIAVEAIDALTAAIERLNANLEKVQR